MPNKKTLKIVQINTVPNGSTGSIMMSIHRQLTKDGYDSYVVWGRGRKAENDHEINMNDKIGVYFHVLYSRLTGKTGFASKKATKKLLNKLDKIKPDIIHLHNVHGYYINIKLLFDYINRNNIKTVWTLHDCWAFTGHCCNFESTNCKCWNGEKCINIKSYPKALINNSIESYREKQKIINSINKITFITPSIWLKNTAKKSFIRNKKIIVIPNGINTNVFKNYNNNNFKKIHNIDNKKIILGVASLWSDSKGLGDFIELSKRINSKYVIVLVGLNKKQLREIPNNIIGIEKTENIEEMVDIYNSASIFLNLTKEDNYPTVNIEAIACGTPVLTYNTGGSPESARLYGRVIDKEKLLNNSEKLFEEIYKKKNGHIDEKAMYQRYRVVYEKI